MSRQKHDALWVGQWAAPFLLLGVYNKIVKVAGHDKEHGKEFGEKRYAGQVEDSEI